MNCPVCGGRGVGKVGIDQFFCSDCYVEYHQRGEEFRIFEVAEDGSLMAYDDWEGLNDQWDTVVPQTTMMVTK